MKTNTNLCMDKKFKNFVVLKVINIQQSETVISSEKYDKYSNSHELFLVRTFDDKFKRLYTYNEAHKIVKDLLAAGYISFSDYYSCDKKGNKKGLQLESELFQQLIDISENQHQGVAYKREELAKYNDKLCVIHGNQMHCNGQDIPAFRYSSDDNTNEIATIGKMVAKPEEFMDDFRPFIENRPLVQFTFAYYLSGAIRQVLSNKSEGTGEYGLVVCVTGEPASGKTTVTLTLQNILFRKGGQLTNNVTSIGIYNTLRNSGICPVVLDDSSTNTRASLSDSSDKMWDVYNIASGRGRITANSEEYTPIYAPFIESREGDWALADVLKPINKVEGYKYRILEIHCNKGDLTKDSQDARKFGALSSKYTGMATIFLDYLVDHYSEEEIKDLYNENVRIMCTDLNEAGLEDRYANRVAVILTAAQISAKAYGFSMDLEGIKAVILDSIKAFESRIVTEPENIELKRLYQFFTATNEIGEGLNDRFIVDKKSNYQHASHYISFMERNADQFVIPKVLFPLVIGCDNLNLNHPGFWGYGRDCMNIETPHDFEKRHLNAVLNEWANLGILIRPSGRTANTISANLGGINTTCYQFSWKKIAKFFDRNTVLDKTRFVHDTEEEKRASAVKMDF